MIGQFRTRDRSPILGKGSNPSAGGGAPAVYSKGVGSVIGNSIVEQNVWRLVSSSQVVVETSTVIRWQAIVTYSCTGTPILTFRIRTGEATDVDLAAQVDITCRLNAAVEPIMVELVSVLDGSVWRSCLSLAVLAPAGGIGGTIWCGVALTTGITEATIKRIALTAQWSAASPSNELGGKSAMLEILPPTGFLA